MSDQVTKVSFKPGDVIFREGEVSAHFFIIEEGKVAIFAKKDGKHTKLGECGPGESFGEMAMLDKSPRSASVQALTDVQAFKVTEQGFEELLSQLPDWASCMLKNFVARLKKMNQQLE